MNSKEKDFSNRELNLLSEVFNGFKEYLGEGFKPRRKIDKEIMDLLGIPTKDQEKILKRLYPDLIKEIGVLKKLI